MPGQMPEMLSRGANLQKLDTLLAVATGKQQAVQTALEGLPPGGNPNVGQDLLRTEFLQLTKDNGIFTGADEDHFNDDWLKGGWWPEAHPVAPVLVNGFIKALKVARGLEERTGPALDIQTVWVCTPPSDQDAGTADTGRVHVGITWNTKCVIVVINTPRLPDDGVVQGPLDQVVVVRWDGPKESIVEKRPGPESN